MDGRRGGRDRMGSSYAGFASNHSKTMNDRDSHRSYDDRPGSPRGGGRGFFGSGRGRGRGRYDGRGRGSLRDVVSSGSLTTNTVHAERFEPSPTSAIARRPVDRPSASPDPSGYESGEIMPQRPMVHPRRSITSTVEPPTGNHFETAKGGGGGRGGGSVDGRGARFDTRGRDGPSGRFFPATNRQRPGGRGGDSYSSGRPGDARFQEPPRAIEISRNNDPPGPRERPRDLITENPRSIYPDSDRGGLDRAHDAKRPREDLGYHVDHEDKRFRVRDYGQRTGLEDASSLGGPPLDSKFRTGENFQRFDHDRGQLEPRTALEIQRRDDRRGRMGQPVGSDRLVALNSDRLDSHVQLTSGSSRYNDANAIGIDTETGRYKDSERIGMDARPGRYAEVDRVRLDSRATRVIDSDRRGLDGGPGRPVDTNRLQQDGGPSRYVHPERKGLDGEQGRFNHSSGISPARYHDSDRIHSDDGPGRYRDAELLHTDNGPNRFNDSDRRGADRGPGRQGGNERFPHDGGHGRYIDSDRRITESGPGRPVDVDRFPQDAGPGRYIDSDRRVADAAPARHFSGDRFPPDGGSGRYIDSDRRVPDNEFGRHLEIDRFPQDGGPSRFNDSDRRGPDRGPGRCEVSDRRGPDSGPSRYFEPDHRASNGGSGRYNESDIKRSDNAPIRYRDSDHLLPDNVPERLIDSERTRGPDSGPPRRFDVDRSHPESGPARYIDSDRSAAGGFSDSMRTGSAGPGRYNDTDRRRVDSGPGRFPDSYPSTANQDRVQGRNKDFNRTGMDRELTVSRNTNVDRFGSDSGFHRFNANNSTRPGPDSGPGPYNDNTHVTPDMRLGRYDAPDRTESDSKQSRFTVNDTDRITPVVGPSRYDDSRNHAGTFHEPAGPSTRNLQRIPSSSMDDPRGGTPPSMTRRDHEMTGKVSYRDDPRDSSFQNEGSHHPTARLDGPIESRYRGTRPSEDPTLQRPRPHPPIDTRGRDTPVDAPRRDNPHDDMRASTETKRDMDTRSHSPIHDRASRPLPPPADGDQSRDFRGGQQAPVETTSKPNWMASQFGQGHISTSGPPRRNVGRQSLEAGPRYREELRQPDMPFSDSSRPVDGRGFFADRGRGRGRGGRGAYSRGGGFFGQGRRRSEDEQAGVVGQGPTAFNDQESSKDPLGHDSNDGDKKPISDAVPPPEDSMVQDGVHEVQESKAMPEAVSPQDMPPTDGTEANPDNDRDVVPEPIEIEIETDCEEEEQRVSRPISPPPPGQPSGVVLALARLADLEAQMEYAYAKHMLLVRRQNELKFQTKVLEELPVGIDAFREELDSLKSEASLEVVQ